MAKITVNLPYVRSTKGTHLFATQDPSEVVTSLYVKKSAFKVGQVPFEISVTVVSEDEVE